MKYLSVRLLSFLALAVVSGCVPSLSPDVYDTNSAGQIQRVERGVIISRRLVQVRDDLNASEGGLTGVLTGGALGGLAGSTIGGGRGNAMAAVGGAVAGGILGNLTQQRLTTQQAFSYVVEVNQGKHFPRKLVYVVQGTKPELHIGQYVFLQYNAKGRARVVAAS